MRVKAILLSVVVAVGCNAKDQPAAEREQGHQHEQEHKEGHAHGSAEHEGQFAARTKLDVRAGSEPKAGVEAKLRMTIQGKDGEPIKAFKEFHEAKVHLVVVRSGLDQFAHLHPEVNAESGELSVEYTFPLGGTYHLFADFQEEGGTPGVAVGEITVAGDAPAAPDLKTDVPGTITGDGLTAQISVEGTKAGEDWTISFVLSTPDGKPATDLEPYMGAKGHLNVVSEDASQYVHSHPAEGGEHNEVRFTAHFEAPGLYKGWGQFKSRGQVQIVPFVLRVD